MVFCHPAGGEDRDDDGMPAAAGLFHRAATMSGQQVTASGHALKRHRARARAYLAKLGLDERKLDTLLTATGAKSWWQRWMRPICDPRRRRLSRAGAGP